MGSTVAGSVCSEATQSDVVDVKGVRVTLKQIVIIGIALSSTLGLYEFFEDSDTLDYIDHDHMSINLLACCIGALFGGLIYHTIGLRAMLFFATIFYGTSVGVILLNKNFHSELIHVLTGAVTGIGSAWSWVIAGIFISTYPMPYHRLWFFAVLWFLWHFVRFVTMTVWITEKLENIVNEYTKIAVTGTFMSLTALLTALMLTDPEFIRRGDGLWIQSAPRPVGFEGIERVWKIPKESPGFLLFTPWFLLPSIKTEYAEYMTTLGTTYGGLTNAYRVLVFYLFHSLTPLVAAAIFTELNLKLVRHVVLPQICFTGNTVDLSCSGLDAADKDCKDAAGKDCKDAAGKDCKDAAGKDCKDAAGKEHLPTPGTKDCKEPSSKLAACWSRIWSRIWPIIEPSVMWCYKYIKLIVLWCEQCIEFGKQFIPCYDAVEDGPAVIEQRYPNSDKLVGKQADDPLFYILGRKLVYFYASLCLLAYGLGAVLLLFGKKIRYVSSIHMMLLGGCGALHRALCYCVIGYYSGNSVSLAAYYVSYFEVVQSLGVIIAWGIYALMGKDAASIVTYFWHVTLIIAGIFCSLLGFKEMAEDTKPPFHIPPDSDTDVVQFSLVDSAAAHRLPIQRRAVTPAVINTLEGRKSLSKKLGFIHSIGTINSVTSPKCYHPSSTCLTESGQGTLTAVKNVSEVEKAATRKASIAGGNTSKAATSKAATSTAATSKAATSTVASGDDSTESKTELSPRIIFVPQ